MSIDEPSVDFPLVSETTGEALDRLTPRARSDFERMKSNLLSWLLDEGKDPLRGDGYSDETVRVTNYRLGEVFRWLWDQRGAYTTDLQPGEATEFIKHLLRETEYEDSYIKMFERAINHYFSYREAHGEVENDWDHGITLKHTQRKNRHYLRRDEFRPLFETALDYGTVRQYHSCTPEERDEIKALLAQRFEKPKDDVTKEDFERANSWKIPSMIATTLDVGFRPVEMERSHLGWLDLDNAVLDIPRPESSKNESHWRPVLSDNAVVSLQNWLKERRTYEKYEGRDEIWLTKATTPYKSNSLNNLLANLIEESNINPGSRDLTWYSIRHGVATYWAQEMSIADAKEQLRHLSENTTLSYTHSSEESRKQGRNHW